VPTVKFTNSANAYLDELTATLFWEGYFGFMDSALQYISRMRIYIELNIGSLSKYPAPPYFSKYQKGMQYVRYPSNKRTTWYFFFLQEGNKYLVCYITNNHFEGQYIR
jgi:hypothetical protein